MQSKENVYPSYKEARKTRQRDHISLPLKDVNYRHHQVPSQGMMKKSIQPSQEDVDTHSLTVPGEPKQKQKISLTEYRARAKSKSPNKKIPEEVEGQDVGQVSSTEKLKERHVSVATAGEAETSSMLRHMSDDLANMSIDEPAYLDETTGQLSKGSTTDQVPSATVNRLKLKKSSSSTSCGVREKVDSDRGSRSYSALPGLKETEAVSVETIRQSDTIKPEHTQYSVGVKNSEKTTSGEVIDLTEDDSETSSQSGNIHAQSSHSSSSSSSSSTSLSKGFGTMNQVSSFGDLSRQSVQQAGQSTSQQWTVMRDPSMKGLQSSSQADSLLDTEQLKQSLERNIQTRNDLVRTLEKQKILVASVKMSQLPDKGAKLQGAIEKLTSDLQLVNLSINNKLSKLNSTTGKKADTHKSQSAPKEPQVVRVHPDGSHSVPSGPQVIKVHPDGRQTLVSGVTQLPSGIRVVKVHPGSSGLHQPHNPDKLKQTTLMPHVAQIPPHILQQMYAANPQAMQLYGGRMTAARLKEVGSVTKEAIERLHRQLETIPGSSTELEDPEGLNLSLMPHQRQALAWLTWREQQTPSGGILADDMGLGKTLTMISLILKQRQVRTDGCKEDKAVWLNRDKQLEKLGKSVVKSNATLVVCPASLIHQWRTEIERRCDEGLLRVCLYHGPNREKNILKLSGYDVVLTTYNIVSKEVILDESDKNGDTAIKDETNQGEEEKDGEEKKSEKAAASPIQQTNIMKIAWERIILDEGHSIKNHKSQQSRAVSRLRAGFRWVLTGTPIQNDLLDMYSLLRFLRCSPFDEYKVWKRQVDTNSRSGQSRLNVLVKTLLLRRTKSQTTEAGKPLVELPDKCVTTHELTLSDQEKQVYDRVFDQSRSALKEYLKRHEDKELGRDSSQHGSNPFSNKISDTGSFMGSSDSKTTASASQIALNMGASNSGKMKAQHILVMLLRLRQCCCHLSLMKDALDDETQENEGVELTLEEQLMDLALSDSVKGNDPANTDSGASTTQEREPALTKSSPIFQKEAVSTKMQALLDELQKIHRPKDSTERCKSVIVSQWTKMLEIVQVHLTRLRLKCSLIRGDIPAKKRMEYVDMFNNDANGPEVMLVSLRAGGCGLNLIGGNHLFLLDNHWNPALEDQACDRIYRVGQKKNVYIHRFLCKDTVEDKIIALQKKKQTLADNVLSGGSSTKTKLSLADLRMLFNV